MHIRLFWIKTAKFQQKCLKMKQKSWKYRKKCRYASTLMSCISFPMAFGEKPFGDKLLQVMNFRKVTSVQFSGYGWFSIILLAQDWLKMCSNWFKIVKMGSKFAQNWVQNWWKLVQNGLKMCSKLVQNWDQMGSKLVQNWFQIC